MTPLVFRDHIYRQNKRNIMFCCSVQICQESEVRALGRKNDLWSYCFTGFPKRLHVLFYILFMRLLCFLPSHSSNPFIRIPPVECYSPHCPVGLVRSTFVQIVTSSETREKLNYYL